jgi:hypothetical protein
MQDWSLHSDSTGGYFQCNRFVENAKSKEGSDGLDQLRIEEGGNAHAETIRLREKNKRMARFIHHYTRFVYCFSILLYSSIFRAALFYMTLIFYCRYQAHGESVEMEGRMFKATSKRIEEGLQNSMNEGSVKWLQGHSVPNPLKHTAETEMGAQSLSPNLEFLNNGFEELLKCRKVILISFTTPSLIQLIFLG